MKRLIPFLLAISLPAYAGMVLGLQSRGPFQNLAALTFNGTTQYLTAPTNSAINPNYNTAFWSTFRIKTSQAGGNPTLLSNLDSTGKGLYYLMRNAGTIEVHLYDNAEAHQSSVRTTSASVNDGSNHCVIVQKGTSSAASSWQIYVDGTSAALTTITDTLGTNATTTTATVTIGADLLGAGGSAEGFFNGYLNQFAFTQGTTLNSSQASSICGSSLAKDLSQYYPSVWQGLVTLTGFSTIDTIASNGLKDRGTAGVNFTPVAMTSSNIVQNPQVNVYGRQSIHGNGSNTLFNAGTPAALQPEFTDTFSFHFWMYIDQATLSADVSFMGNNPAFASGGWNIVANSSPLGRMQFELDALPYTGTQFFGIEGNAGDIPLRQQFDMGGSYDGSNSPNGQKVYINGSLVSTTTYGGVSSLSGTIKGFPLTFMGQGTGLGQEVNGYGYNPSFWNSVLTAADFKALHDNGPLIAPTALASYASHCVAFWPMKNFNLALTGGTVTDIKGGNNATVTNTLFSTFIPQ